ncbi:EMILIN-2-like [Crassostrea angulata]|uniref:EMILIN-2-like n=1 Tax=Magallana angulata TaxID=2784310 RepID=UPI0022B19AEA|nr:EMILIN-2-like [Crassostrea angulata]
MLLTLLFALSFGLLDVAYSGNNVQTDLRTNIDLLKSLIYDNTKATVTLDSLALKQLIQMFSDSSNTLRIVSFSVNLKSKPLTLGAGQTVKYNTVLTNDGNGYDDRTGVFTCPVAGTYMFVVDSLSKATTLLHLNVNKITVGRLYVSYVHGGDTYVQMSRTVIVKLKSGDHVKVENVVNNGYIRHFMYSEFSGVLLY